MSLRRIALRDFVIVRELELDLDTGFCVLTGETGAGKSILIDALQLADDHEVAQGDAFEAHGPGIGAQAPSFQCIFARRVSK